MSARNYIRICGNILNADKVIHVGARNSHLYWRHPYIMELQYAKQWTETDYVNVGGKASYSIPINTHHDSMWFKYKYTHYEDAQRELKRLRERCSNSTWSDTSQRKSSF